VRVVVAGDRCSTETGSLLAAIVSPLKSVREVSTGVLEDLGATGLEWTASGTSAALTAPEKVALAQRGAELLLGDAAANDAGAIKAVASADVWFGPGLTTPVLAAGTHRNCFQTTTVVDIEPLQPSSEIWDLPKIFVSAHAALLAGSAERVLRI